MYQGIDVVLLKVAEYDYFNYTFCNWRNNLRADQRRHWTHYETSAQTLLTT